MKKKLEYYTASWCGPCKMAKPIIYALMEEGYNIEIIDVDENYEKAQSKGIRSVPTLIFTEKGKTPKRYSGMISPQEIRTQLSDGGQADTINV
jgi:thioredoxin 1